MRYFDARIIENRALGNGYFVLRLGGCESLAGSRPGQFMMLRGDWGRDPLLPRPMSLLSVAPEGRADLLARAVGQGTRLLESALPGTRVSILGPLGNGFPEPTQATLDLLVAGGVGMPPLFMQAEHAAHRGLIDRCEMIYGGRTARDLVLLAEMRGLGLAPCLATEDGSVGRRGRVTAALEARIEHHRAATPDRRLRIMACGPREMLWAVARIAEPHAIECYLSVEEQMACGIGVCLGCAMPARSRPFRYACSDGPVFLASDLVIPPAPGQVAGGAP
ncbi:MAG: dihydroorotate dehydrogenase electron transfer subunit [Deltaproteobacteria bacterium]|nr:dihydroorotate dehydrogenase electron transfer subunit [Deltaproteobacteria bacterium]